MSTIQLERKEFEITLGDYKEITNNLKTVMDLNKISFDQAIKIRELLLLERQIEVSINNGELMDEKIAELNRSLENIEAISNSIDELPR